MINLSRILLEQSPAPLDFDHPVFQVLFGLNQLFSTNKKLQKGISGITVGKHIFAFCNNKRKIQKGTILAACYEVQALLGEGAFGMVIKCLHTTTRSHTAVKIIKNDPDHYRNAEKEINILKELQILDPDQSSVVKWMGFFLHQNLICMEFELLDISLSTFMEKRQFRPLTLDELRPIVNQLSMALFYLMSIKIIHRDIKPENIMVVDHKKEPVLVKLIDFGMASKVVDVCSCVVQTLWYRAPEVLLCGCYTESIDMWSLGLVAAELALGFVVFPAEDTYDMMKFIVECLGQPSKDTLHRGESTHIFFNVKNNNTERTWTLKTPAEISKEFQHKFRDTRYVPFISLEALLFSRISSAALTDTCHFVDLVMNMLLVDDNERIKPLDVLKHPFLYREQHADRDRNHSCEQETSIMTADAPQNSSGDMPMADVISRVAACRREVEDLKKALILSLENFLNDIMSEREKRSRLGEELKSMIDSQQEMNLRWETLEEQAVIFQNRIDQALKTQEERQGKGVEVNESSLMRTEGLLEESVETEREHVLQHNSSVREETDTKASTLPSHQSTSSQQLTSLNQASTGEVVGASESQSQDS